MRLMHRLQGEFRADPVPLHAYARPVLAGLLVAALGIVPWTLLARRNAVFRPDVPWAALTTIAYLALLVAWLDGAGWPRRTAAFDGDGHGTHAPRV